MTCTGKCRLAHRAAAAKARRSAVAVKTATDRKRVADKSGRELKKAVAFVVHYAEHSANGDSRIGEVLRNCRIVSEKFAIKFRHPADG